MASPEFVNSATLLFVLLNPFFISIYLLDLIQDVNSKSRAAVLLRGATISSLVFIAFALVGGAVFTDVLQVRFASFLLFGGLVFLIVSLRSFFIGANALRELRGKPDHVVGSIAMPFIIGPETLSASIWTGHRLTATLAIFAILIPVVVSVIAVIGRNRTYDLIHDGTRRW